MQQAERTSFLYGANAAFIEELFRKAGEAAGQQARPVADIRGPIEYKRGLTAELTVRSLRSAVQRALEYA